MEGKKKRIKLGARLINVVDSKAAERAIVDTILQLTSCMEQQTIHASKTSITRHYKAGKLFVKAVNEK